MFSSVLIANRGEIACRIAATCRRLGVRTIAVYSEADAGAPHTKAADEAHYIGPAPALDSYLNVPVLLRVIRDSGAEAVHPGYGFLSENAAFAAEVAQNGAVFVGPRPEALRLLSDKVGARETALQSGFVPVPGSAGSISTAEPAVLEEIANRIGYPVLVKAAGGGGGIGMQRAQGSSDLSIAIERATTISERSFADGRVYLEKYIERPRHVEIQAFRAHSGLSGVLGTRECSVQRRYQKLIEECPSPSLSSLAKERLREVEASACGLLERVEYVGVATIEMLLGADENPYFLEVNARLQVEHTVTEVVFGIDLVELQLRLAAHEDVSDLLAAAHPSGHAVQARVYSEDPAKGFLPQPGTIQQLEFPCGPGVRVDSGIETGATISPYYDPLLAKVIGWGPSRADATCVLLDALSNTRIAIVSKERARANNIEFLRSVLGTSEWASAKYDTTLVEQLLARACT